VQTSQKISLNTRLVLALTLLILAISSGHADTFQLPTGDLLIVEAENGQLIIQSPNSRYVFEGNIRDTWGGKYLVTAEDFRRSAETLPIKGLNLNESEYNTFSIGSGSNLVWIWADPLCESCRAVARLVSNEKFSEYRFVFFLIPALGGESVELVKKAACEPDREKVKQAFIAAELSKLPAISCAPLRSDITAMMAQVLRIQVVPTVVSNKGIVFKGIPTQLKDWLNQNSKG